MARPAISLSLHLRVVLTPLFHTQMCACLHAYIEAHYTEVSQVYRQMDRQTADGRIDGQTGRERERERQIDI